MNNSQFKRTTIYFPIRLYEELKIMGVLTQSSMSRVVCEAVRDKIKQLKERKNEY